MEPSSDNPNENSEIEERDLDRLVSNAFSESVTEERLTQLDTTGIVSRGIKLIESPLIEYLKDNEKPHYILFSNGSTTTLQAPEANEMLEKAGGWPSITILLTDENIIIIQSVNRDLCVSIPLESVTDCEVQADSREVVVEVEDSEIIENLFNKFNQSADIDTEVSKLKIDLNNANKKRDIEGFGEYISEVGAHSPDNGESSSLAPDLASYLSKCIDVLYDEDAQFIDISVKGSPNACYQIASPDSHNIRNLSRKDYIDVEKFVEYQKFSILDSENKGGQDGYVMFSTGEEASVELGAKIAEKLLSDIHNIDDVTDVTIDIAGVPEENIPIKRSSPTKESQSLSDVLNINCNVTVHPDPPEGELSKIMGGESSVAVKKDLVEHSKLLGSGHKELIYEYSPNQNLLIGNDGVSVDSGIIEADISYNSILDVELLQDKDLNVSSLGYVFHSTDYVRLTVGNYACPFCENYTGLYDSVTNHISSADDEVHIQDQKRTFDIDSVFYIYLVGKAERFSYTGGRFEGDDEFTIENQPSIKSSELEHTAEKISKNIDNREEDAYVLQDYIQRRCNLKVEGWQESGVTDIKGGMSGSFNSSGKAKGVEVGPFIRSKSKSEGSVSAEIDGSISDDSFTSKINFLQISEDGIFVDSDPVLNFGPETKDSVLRWVIPYILFLGQYHILDWH
jgi:hypothetical protein